MICAEPFYVNLDWYNSLPDDYKKIVEDAAVAMMEENSRITDKENNAYIEEIKANGCEVTVLTAEQRDSFRAPAEEVWKKYVESGRITKDQLVEMLAVIDKTVSW